ncbi:hypothetical protein [Bacillus sp. FJAT-52991]|uniref:Uncharacterized protein n=1 Tax=Bacillus kandeliae TaxID=3129297 RepID=A0ABZ2N2A5_9BACI
MKRIYSFKVSLQHKQKKYYTLSANRSIQRKIEYPFKVSLVEIIDAVILPYETNQSTAVTLPAVDVTLYHLTEEIIIEGYWIEDSALHGVKNISSEHVRSLGSTLAKSLSVVMKEHDIHKNDSVNDVKLLGKDHSVFRENSIHTVEPLEDEVFNRMGAYNGHIIKDDPFASKIEARPTDMLEVSSFDRIRPIYYAENVQEDTNVGNYFIYHSSAFSESTLNKESVIESEEKNITLMWFTDKFLVTDLIEEDALSLYATEVDEMNLDASNSVVTLTTQGIQCIEHSNTSREINVLDLLSSELNDSIDIVISDLKRENSSNSKIITFGVKKIKGDESNLIVPEVNISQMDADEITSQRALIDASLLQNDIAATNSLVDVVDQGPDMMLALNIGMVSMLTNTDPTLNETENETIITFSDESITETFENAATININESQNDFINETVMNKQDIFSDTATSFDADVLMNETFTENKKEIKAGLNELDGNQQYAIAADEVKFDASQPELFRYETSIVQEFDLDGSDKVVSIDNIVDDSLVDVEKSLDTESFHFNQLLSINEINVEQIRIDEIESGSFTIADLINPNQLSSDSLIVAENIETESTFVYKVIDVAIQHSDLMYNETEFSTTITLLDDFEVSTVVSISVEETDNLSTNPIFETTVITDHAMSVESLFETEAIKLTETEWLSDIPTDLIDLDNSNEIEDIKSKKKVWLIPARANWYSKWFNKKTR